MILDEESLARLKAANPPMARKRGKGSPRPVAGSRVLPMVDPLFEPRRPQGLPPRAVPERPVTDDIEWF